MANEANNFDVGRGTCRGRSRSSAKSADVYIEGDNLAGAAQKVEKVVQNGAFWCMADAPPAKLSEFRGFCLKEDASSVHQNVVHSGCCGAFWCIRGAAFFAVKCTGSFYDVKDARKLRTVYSIHHSLFPSLAERFVTEHRQSLYKGN